MTPAERIRALKIELIGLIDAGADDDYTVYVRQGDVCKWFDELDAIELEIVTHHPSR